MELEQFRKVCYDYADNNLLRVNNWQAADLTKIFQCAEAEDIVKDMTQIQAGLIAQSYFTGYCLAQKGRPKR
tara:strand:- start:3 stop:218 length:216 start_codon:yes stop_codon:yes gene_type:complete